MKNYVKPEITVKEYRVTKDIADLNEYYYTTGESKNITVSLFVLSNANESAV